MDSKKDQIDAESVRSLANLLQETGLTEIEYQVDTLRIRVTRSVQVTNAVLPITPAQQMQDKPSTPHAQYLQFQQSTIHTPDKEASLKGPVNGNVPDKPELENEVSGDTIKSPMVGVIYIASSPGADPFVRVGDTVSEGQTLLVIEAMKVMNIIKAPRPGIIKHILVKDRQPVEYDEPLMIIA